MTIMPASLYLVIRDYRPIGIGSPDITDDRDLAYDHFTSAVDDGDPVAVWQIDTYGNIPVRITDQTDQFEHEMQEICIQRDLDWNEVIHFQGDLPRIAAE